MYWIDVSHAMGSLTAIPRTRLISTHPETLQMQAQQGYAAAAATDVRGDQLRQVAAVAVSGPGSRLPHQAATTIAFLLGKSRKRYGCVRPTCLAIASVEGPQWPSSANSAIAAGMTLSRLFRLLTTPCRHARGQGSGPSEDSP